MGVVVAFPKRGRVSEDLPFGYLLVDTLQCFVHGIE